MKEKIKGLLKDTIVFAFGTLGSKIILFLLVPLYTNYLNAEQYGTAEFVITIGQLIVPFMALSIWEAVLRIGLINGQKKNDVLCNSLIILGIGMLLMICVTPMLSIYSPIKEWRWYLCWYSIFYCSTQIELNYLKVIGKNKMFAGLSLMQTFLLALLNYILIVDKKLGVEGYLLSIILSSMVTSILIFVFGKYASELKSAKPDKQLSYAMVKYSAPLIINNISWWLIHSSDKIMIEWMLTTVELGVYTVATKIPGLINVVTSVFSQAWGISSIKEIETSNDTSFYSKIFEGFSMCVFGIVIGFTLIIKPFMKIYVGTEFTEAWRYVPLLLVAAAFAAISSFMGSVLCALKKSSHCMWSTAIGAGINIIFNYIFIKQFGLWGALIGTVSAQGGIAWIRIIDVFKNIKLEIKWKNFGTDIVLATVQAISVSCNYHIYLVSSICLGMFILNHYKMFIVLWNQMKKLKLKKNVG